MLPSMHNDRRNVVNMQHMYKTKFYKIHFLPPSWLDGNPPTTTTTTTKKSQKHKFPNFIMIEVK